MPYATPRNPYSPYDCSFESYEIPASDKQCVHQNVSERYTSPYGKPVCIHKVYERPPSDLPCLQIISEDRASTQLKSPVSSENLPVGQTYDETNQIIHGIIDEMRGDKDPLTNASTSITHSMHSIDTKEVEETNHIIHGIIDEIARKDENLVINHDLTSMIISDDQSEDVPSLTMTETFNTLAREGSKTIRRFSLSIRYSEKDGSQDESSQSIRASVDVHTREETKSKSRLETTMQDFDLQMKGPQDGPKQIIFDMVDEIGREDEKPFSKREPNQIIRALDTDGSQAIHRGSASKSDLKSKVHKPNRNVDPSGGRKPIRPSRSVSETIANLEARMRNK